MNNETRQRCKKAGGKASFSLVYKNINSILIL